MPNIAPLIYKNLHIIAFFLYLSVCQLALPSLNRGHDFFLFSKWSLFSKGSNELASDISWDNGESYLFRDYRERARALGINTNTLFHLMNTKKFQTIKKLGSSLEKIGPLDKMSVFQLNGSLYEHILLRSKLKTVKEYKLFND